MSQLEERAGYGKQKWGTLLQPQSTLNPHARSNTYVQRELTFSP